MKIGIGVTTRNRPEVLSIAMRHFLTYWPKAETKLIVVDDNSDSDKRIKNCGVCLSSREEVLYLYNTERLGVAGSKNVCLDNLKNYDYVFLMDDDCFPSYYGWEKEYIRLSNQTGINHMMFMIEVGNLKLISTRNGVEEFDNCAGCMLFFTREAIDSFRRYNEDFGIYGMEHGMVSLQIYLAGLNNGYGKYLVPEKAKHKIYSLDLHYVNRGIAPDMLRMNEVGGQFKFNSSMEGEDVAPYINHALKHYNKLVENINKPKLWEV